MKKETFFQANRWFLNLGMVVSMLLPLLYFKTVEYVEVSKLSGNEQAHASRTLFQETSYLDFAMEVLFYLYLAGVVIFSIKITIQLLSLYRLIKRGTLKKGNINHVFISENVGPFSFFNNIVYNPNNHSAEELKTIIAHEKVHVRQKHSFDVIFVHLFTSMFWFNPFVWWYKKRLTQNLEFIADKGAVENAKEIKTYQYLLLKKLSGVHYSIINPFYNSLIKNRIVMLQKQKSQKRNIWKYALIFPLLAGFMMLFSFKTETKFKIQNNLQDKEVIQDSTFSDNPLVVIDGVVMPSDFDLDSIDPNTIATMDVSKGALAVAKYGEKAKNGIVEITLKSGKKQGGVENLTGKSENRGSVGVETNTNSEKSPWKITTGQQAPYNTKYFDSSSIYSDDTTSASGSKEGTTNKYVGKTENDGNEVSQNDDDYTMKGSSAAGVIVSVNPDKEKPLFVIDGKVMPKDFDINSVDPKNFNELKILKNEKAIEKYGDQAKNGVVELSLKPSGVASDKEHLTNGQIKIERKNSDGTETDGSFIMQTNGNSPKSLKDALYVVNGKIMPKDFQMKSIDVSNVKHVNILKDQQAIEKYGEKAKDGVVEITLKEK
ncbi:TonB-dependent receptor plug domain-containing protein [Galbibacter sp. BG1]|uniref:M56 family metallopeptidase n=1 Tax=Galbibacter sp. BG1 TaxID=1170699 RepID=UPI0015C10F75|nr:M56 family metallopeptidase [Galbibacter sp. BG1]QLE00400.1 TonB-dependent receptor plug domain-containing protein [Galbibacter sp. BG1]